MAQTERISALSENSVEHWRHEPSAKSSLINIMSPQYSKIKI